MLALIAVNRQCACRERRYFVVRFDAPALSHAITASRETEERRQFDDLRVAVEFPELRIYFLVPPVVECERAGIVESGTSLAVRVLPAGQSAVQLFLFGDRRRKRRGL